MKRVLMIAATCAALAVAQPPGGRGRGPGGRTPSLDSLKTYLTLTDAQVTSLTQLQTQRRTEMQTLANTTRQKHEALRAELAKSAPDGATLGRLMLEIKASRSQGDAIATRFRTQSAAVLTAPQKTRLAALEEAAKLRDEIHEAVGAGLLAPPAEGPAGMGGPFGLREFEGGRRGPGRPQGRMRSAPQ